MPHTQEVDRPDPDDCIRSPGSKELITAPIGFFPGAFDSAFRELA